MFAEESIALLIPQYLLIAGILVITFFPKVLIEAISAAIDPHNSLGLARHVARTDLRLLDAAARLLPFMIRAAELSRY